MKKIKLNTAKLQLNKEKIASLTNDEMSQVKGGLTSIVWCNTSRHQPNPGTPNGSSDCWSMHLPCDQIPGL